MTPAEARRAIVVRTPDKLGGELRVELGPDVSVAELAAAGWELSAMAADARRGRQIAEAQRAAGILPGPPLVGNGRAT